MVPGRILLTGATGFVGRHMARALADAFPAAETFPLRARLGDGLAALRAEAAACRPDACVHLAGMPSVVRARADPGSAWATNVSGTLDLALALSLEAPECLFIHVSSGEAYGKSFLSGEPVKETAPLAPSSEYGATKAAADLALGALARQAGMRVIRARPFNHVGPGQGPGFAMADFARQAALIAAGRQEPVVTVGNLEAERDFLDVRDVCAAYIACIVNGGRLWPGAAVNVASGRTRRLGDVLADVLAHCPVPVEVRQDPDRMRPSDLPRACGDATVARAMLGWKPTMPWEATVADTVAWWSQSIS